MIMGIVYYLEFPNEQIYVGSTTRSLEMRVYEHFYDLRKGLSHNPYLQNLFNKYGAPKVGTLEEDPEDLLSCEQGWVDRFGSRVINLMPVSPPTLGYKHTLEARRVMAEKKKGKPSPRKGVHFITSEETRKKLSEAMRECWARSGNKSTGMLGRTHSPETRKRMSEASRSKHKSEEHCKSMSEAQRGKTHSLETCQKMSQSAKLAWARRKQECLP
jgi:group I intron endonuclease